MRPLYKALSVATSAMGGVVAGALFKRSWKLIAHEEDAPKATDPDHSWREVLAAAALQGAVFGLVKAAVDRAGAAGVARATGSWPTR